MGSESYGLCGARPLTPDYLLKFLVIGNANSGKSCLLHQFIEGKCECPCA